MLEIDKLYHGDCLELMHEIDDGVINLVACDLPYGVTENKADCRILLPALWKGYKRILVPGGAVVLTSQFPFTIDLIQSNRSWFRYDLIWDKVLVSGFLNANRMPLRSHEHILVFYGKLPTYNPQFTMGEQTHSRGGLKAKKSVNYGHYEQVPTNDELRNKKHPTSIIRFQKPHASKALHPTEKPVELFEWLIRTFSNQGDLVLDNTMGSGATPLACIRSERHFIGIDNNPEYVRIAEARIKQHMNQKKVFDYGAD